MGSSVHTAHVKIRLTLAQVMLTVALLGVHQFRVNIRNLHGSGAAVSLTVSSLLTSAVLVIN